jgi:uncharacterized phage-like protein YoqJ
MRIAVSGHRGLDSEVSTLVERSIRAELVTIATQGTELVGVSCLADGADQIFACVVLERGGTLEVVIPADEYRDGLPDEAKALYDKLFNQAAAVHRCDHRESTADAHMDASMFMVSNVDRLFVVWDSQPARSYGGTADVVAYAREKGVPITVIWPPGAHRD